MGEPLAKDGDQVTATDIHIVMVPGPVSPVPTPLPHKFTGLINGNLSSDVKVMGRSAATVDSTADNIPPHIPSPPGTSFQNPPKDIAKITTGSGTVKINGKKAARNGDKAETCNDPSDLEAGQVVAVGTVLVG